jgi:hypothetical protein
MTELAQRIKQRISTLETERTTWATHCQEIVRYLMPFRADVMTPEANIKGVKKMQYIYDSTGTFALLLFAAGLASRMANRAIPWFKVGCEIEELEDIREVKIWLEELQRIYYQVFNKSNFYTADHEAYIDDGGFGQSVMFIGKHPRWRVYFDSINVGECYVAANEYRQIDTLYRKFNLTARNVSRWFGDKASSQVRGYLESNRPHEEIPVIHAVEPQIDRDTSKRDNKNMPWRSVYLENSTNTILDESGFKEFPYVVSRYFVASGEVYGRGPGMVALPDVKELQQKKQDILKAGQKKLSPPLLLPHDGFMGQPIRLTPSGINFINTDAKMSDKIGVFPVAQDLGYEETDLEATRNRIGQVFFNDLMILAQAKEVTATEFIQVAQEKMQMLGPFLGRLQTERYNPIFDRVFNILWDAGEIPPPPPVLIQNGGQLRIDYISPLAKAQRASESQGIVQAVGFAGQTAQVDPSVLDVIDLDEAIRHVAENAGMPQKMIRSVEDVAAIRQAKAEQAQQLQQQQMLLEGAKTLPALSKGPEPGSPMDALAQMMQQGAGNA